MGRRYLRDSRNAWSFCNPQSQSAVIAKPGEFSLDSVAAWEAAVALDVSTRSPTLVFISVMDISRRIETVPLASCPECEAEIHVDDDVDKGEIIHCEECEARLEVVGLDPIELDLAAEDEEDDYDDEDEERY
jgi:alpha-aminoadipate/glutamate carrier protein LysW